MVNKASQLLMGFTAVCLAEPKKAVHMNIIMWLSFLFSLKRSSPHNMLSLSIVV